MLSAVEAVVSAREGAAGRLGFLHRPIERRTPNLQNFRRFGGAGAAYDKSMFDNRLSDSPKRPDVSVFADDG